jgi:hypothetical protein
MVNLTNIADVLNRNRHSFRYLDVFASDVEELQVEANHGFVPAETNVWTTLAGAFRVRMRLFPEANVARFELDDNAGTAGVAAGVAAGAAMGGVLAAGAKGRRGDVSDLMIFGVLIGGLLGALAASPAPATQQVMTLRYDPELKKWVVYHGPYAHWAREALQAPQG